MKYINKLATVFCSAALGLMLLTSCEGGDLYTVGAPSWISAKADSIAEAKKNQSQGPVIEGLQEDVYDIGKADFSAGFFTLGKTYVVPAGQKWQAQFNLTVNPDSKYYKNFYIVLNDFPGALGDEYGVIRFDNDPTKNSEWNTTGTEIDRSLVGGNFTNSSGDDDTDGSVQQMNGLITLTVDRTNGGLFIEMTNGTLTKTYTQTSSFPSTGSDKDLACRIGVEASLVSFLGSTIEPIGGYTSREDKLPLSLVLNNVPDEIVQGTSLADAMANVTATVNFEQGVVKENVPASELTFQAIPDMENLGEKTLVAVYSKTFKGETAPTPVIGYAKFSVVPEIESIAITKTPSFTTYYVFTSEYTTSIDRFLTFNPAGLQVTATYADGSKAVVDNKKLSFTAIPGTSGTYSVEVETFNGKKANIEGIKVVETSDFTTVHPKPTVLGPEDNTGGWWTFFSEDIKVPAGKTYKMDFTNYGGGSNWNNWNIVLRKANMAEYGVVRADNYGWGSGYEGNPFLITSGGQSDWGAWLAAMSAAQVTVYITNIGNGMIDIIAVMNGADGNTYFQYYLGILADDVNDINFAYVIDGDHLVFK